MEKRKKMLSVILSAAMMCTIFAGCGQEAGTGENQAVGTEEASKTNTEEETGADMENDEAGGETEDFGRISEETVTLTLAARYVAGQYTTDFASTDQFQEYERRLGIRFDVSAYDLEQWPSKLTLMLASDEMPDIIAYANMTSMDVEKYGTEGYFLDFGEYLDIMPNLSRILEEYPEYAAAITNENGNIYAFSTLTASADYALVRPIYMSKKWLDNLNLEEPKTLDDLYQVLKAFKEQDANGNGDPSDEIPMGRADGVYWTDMPILWAFGIFGRSEAFYLMAEDDNNVILGDSTENYREYLRFMHKLYDEGLMNVDAFVITSSEVEAMCQDDKVGYWQTWALLPGDVKTDWIAVNGFTTEEFNPVRTNVIYNRADNVYMLAASADTEHPEEIARFVDYLFTEEGSISARSGYEGVSYDLVEEDGIAKIDYGPYAAAAGYDIESDFYAQQVIAANVFTIYQMDMKGGLDDAMQEATRESLYDDKFFDIGGQNVLKEIAIKEDGVQVVSVYPNVKYTADELEARSTLYTDVYNYLVTAKIQFITGELDVDADWDAYLAELDKIGLEKLLEIEQTAYERYIGK